MNIGVTIAFKKGSWTVVKNPETPINKQKEFFKNYISEGNNKNSYETLEIITRRGTLKRKKFRKPEQNQPQEPQSQENKNPSSSDPESDDPYEPDPQNNLSEKKKPENGGIQKPEQTKRGRPPKKK